MQTWLVVAVLIYFAVGLIVYAATDTTEFASRIESTLVAAPLGLVLEYVFFGVVTFWPIWLVAITKKS